MAIPGKAASTAAATRPISADLAMGNHFLANTTGTRYAVREPNAPRPRVAALAIMVKLDGPGPPTRAKSAPDVRRYASAQPVNVFEFMCSRRWMLTCSINAPRTADERDDHAEPTARSPPRRLP